jgi:glycosyltransferase involved in cell wall biosynthesis
LAWFDPSDPTDRALAAGLVPALRRRGWDPVLVGPRRGGAPTRLGGAPFFAVGSAGELRALACHEGLTRWDLHLFGRDAEPFLAAAEAEGWRPATTLHLVLADYLRFAGGTRTLGRLARLGGPVGAVSLAQLREARALAPALASRLKAVDAYGPSLPAVPPRAPGPPTVLYAARLAPYKGPDVLLMAFARLRAAGSLARLVFAGRDASRGAYAVFARRLGLGSAVEFAGELSPRALARRLAAATVFALPSRRDNFPIALLEAMAAGKAVVAARAGGIPELVGRAGLLVPPGDPAALARGLSRVLGDAALRRRLGAAARRRAARFTWGAAAAAYDRLAGRRKPSA